MPSPFPGMDPYLEHPDIFPDFHDRLVTYISESLQASLPEPYFAALGRRAWIEVSERYVGPDVNVLRSGQNKGASCESVAVADRAVTKPIVVHVPHDERSEPLVEVYTGRGSRRRLVTSIEVLSTDVKKGTGTFCRNGPEGAAHKRFPSPFSHGRDLYLRTQKEILQSKAHLVEIDLLRHGRHTTAVPENRLAKTGGAFDYHVCIHQFDNLEDYFVYPIQLDESLPEISVPLLPGEGEVRLDLQQVFQRTYDAGPYRREVDYATELPVPPLSDERTAWAAELIARH